MVRASLHGMTTHPGRTPRPARIAVCVLALALLSPAPVLAAVASIETSAPLADHSPEAIEAAVTEAVVTAVRGALAMGLSWVSVRSATVHDELVTVEVVATDIEPDDAASTEPDTEPAQPARVDL